METLKYADEETKRYVLDAIKLLNEQLVPTRNRWIKIEEIYYHIDNQGNIKPFTEEELCLPREG